jgi:hypothetical protein
MQGHRQMVLSPAEVQAGRDAKLFVFLNGEGLDCVLKIMFGGPFVNVEGLFVFFF